MSYVYFTSVGCSYESVMLNINNKLDYFSQLTCIFSEDRVLWI